MKEELEKLKSELTQRIDQIIKQSSERKEGWYRNPEGEFAHTSGYGIHSTFDWQDEQYWFESYNNWTPASPKEVEEALIKVAEKMGFKEGVAIKRPWCTTEVITMKSNEFHYIESLDSLTSVGREIYLQGQWAEIISEPKLKLGGHEVELIEGNTRIMMNITGYVFDKSAIHMLSKATQEEYTNLLNKMKS